MSYSIITKTKKGIINEIPVSANDFFKQYWLPLFEKYQLENLSNWKYPHDFGKDELKLIIQELEQLLPYINVEREKERARFILNNLKNINFDDYEYINLG